jgi:hypothetical protein
VLLQVRNAKDARPEGKQKRGKKKDKEDRKTKRFFFRKKRACFLVLLGQKSNKTIIITATGIRFLWLGVRVCNFIVDGGAAYKSVQSEATINKLKE